MLKPPTKSVVPYPIEPTFSQNSTRLIRRLLTSCLEWVQHGNAAGFLRVRGVHLLGFAIRSSGYAGAAFFLLASVVLASCAEAGSPAVGASTSERRESNTFVEGGETSRGEAGATAHQSATTRMYGGTVGIGGDARAADRGGADSMARVGGGSGRAGGSVNLAGGSSTTNTCRAGSELAPLDDAEYARNCVECAGDDTCLQCVCTHCTSEVRRCSDTPGCFDISACVQNSGCTGIDCYCGQSDAVTCALGQAAGPCRDAMVRAPSGRIPTIANPSAGPASDAAVAISTCLDNDATECKAACQ